MSTGLNRALSERACIRLIQDTDCRPYRLARKTHGGQRKRRLWAPTRATCAGPIRREQRSTYRTPIGIRSGAGLTVKAARLIKNIIVLAGSAHFLYIFWGVGYATLLWDPWYWHVPCVGFRPKIRCFSGFSSKKLNDFAHLALPKRLFAHKTHKLGKYCVY